MIAALLLPATAVATDWSSDPQELHFGNTDPVFDVLDFDTGYLPSFGSPISVRFHITPSGGVLTDMDVESRLEWPDALQHVIVGVPGSGWFGVDADIEIEAEVHIDIFGLWTGSVNLWSENLEMLQGAAFDPPLLGEAVEGTANNQNLVPPFEYGITVFVGLEVVLSLAVYPELSTSLEGVQITTDGPVDSVYQLSNNSPQTLGMPGDRPAELPLTSTYWAQQSTVLSLVLEPAVSLDTLLGDFDLLSFPIAIPFVDSSELRSFEAVDYSHPLPATGPLEEAHDFGDVPLGTLVNLELPIENVGLMGLEGTIRIDGDGAFSVYPDTLYAQPGAEDGVVISFAPNAPGIRAAELVFESNDPGAAVQVIQLVGNGWTDPPADEPTEDTPGADLTTQAGSADLQTCGCSGSGSPSWWWLGVAVAILRRRQT